MLRRAHRFAGAAVEVREEVVPAVGIARALASLAGDVDACMLVVGRDTSGRVTRALISQAPCAVAVTPLSVPLPMTEPLKRIAVAYDGSVAAQAALVAATMLARAAGARLVLYSAGRTAAHAAAWLHIAGVVLDATIEHESCQLVGDAATELGRISGEVDLLVCGSRGRGRAVGAVLGSVSAHLAAHAQCPVLVVPPLVWRADGDPLHGSAAGANA
jgi:nucleotide-binding universal stress UspA family protein